MDGYRRLLRPVLFRIGGGDPEAAHEHTVRLLGRVSDSAVLRRLHRLAMGSAGTPVRVAGIDFDGRVGLAAGMDKDGRAVRAWAGFGFTHAELGTVTAEAQPGNPRPRLFRLPGSTALINRMGFNNAGAAALAERLAARGIRRGNRTAGMPIGISIGKTKATPLESAVEDYLTSARLLSPHADYLAINVSSPNTPGLRALQAADALAELLTAIVTDARTASETASGSTASTGPVPIFVKVAPDLTFAALEQLIEVCEQTGVAGLIATNTTVDRTGLAPTDHGAPDHGSPDLERAAETGGLSGAPLTVRAREVVAFLADRTSLPVIGVGGIVTAADAQAMFDAGAQLVQLYTGFIYAGPGLIRAINSAEGSQTPRFSRRVAAFMTPRRVQEPGRRGSNSAEGRH